jgi:carbonic anhydrase/acetyltransferase-like protein (isoleucine patch superfamily)
MKKVIIRDRRKITPFNEPARDLRVLNKPLWLYQRDVLAPYCTSEVEVESLAGVPADEPGEMLVYRDSLFFDQPFLDHFLERARALGKACQVAFSLSDRAITTHALTLAGGIRQEGDVYVADMWYYPGGWEDATQPLVVDTQAQEIGFYRVPTHMSTEAGDLVYHVPLRAFLSIENWVHLFVANCTFGIFAESARLEGAMDNLGLRLRILWRSLMERRQFLSSSAVVSIGRDVQLDPTAVIQGPAVIGDNCSIGPGTVISNCIIGNNVNIMQGCQLLLSVVSDRCYLPFRAALFMSTLMEDCMVAQNSCLQLCVVGRDSFIGAGTTFTDFNLVPKPVRTLHQGQLEEVGLTVLGGGVGHHCRIGSGLTFYPGRIVESDVMLTARDGRSIISRNVMYEDSDHLGTPYEHLHPRLYPR